MARIVLPEVNNEEEGYEQPLDPSQDALVANGFYPQTSSTPDTTVGIERVGGQLVLKDQVSGSQMLADLLGGGATSIISYLPEGPAFSSFKEVVGDPFPSEVIWWTSPAKTGKVYEEIYTRDANKQPITIVYKYYSSDGTTVVSTITETITYQGVKEISRTRVVS